ncbi:Ig-like domain-containing protein [Bowmanella denitrificans]|uniref:Ig-like domain-containing protein n=1 Tax=Bowmanella denitrificans TaxID=366582 RepID=UPI000C9CE941|nr:Ig-like domain-containing protein [Bowmanella denitrificans]
MFKRVQFPVAGLLCCLPLVVPSEVYADWQKLTTTNQFNDVAFTKQAHDNMVATTNSANFWGVVGPTAVFDAWNSSVFDKHSNTMYFFGGGHSDYGGNEVYQLDLNENVWTRLTDPAPLIVAEPHSELPAYTVHIPASTPLSPHTYDGILWNPVTNSIWMASSAGYGGVNLPSHAPHENTVWEFSPQSRQWTKYVSEHTFHYPKSAVRANGDMLFISGSAHNALLVKPDGTQKSLGPIRDLGGTSVVSTLFVNPETNEFYSSNDKGIYKLDVRANSVAAEQLVAYPSLEELNYSMDLRQAAFNYRPVDKKFYIWNGGPELITWDPSTNQFEVIWNENQPQTPSHSGKGAGKVFDKFIYQAQQDIFLGLQNAGSGLGSDGVWVWTPTPNPADINKLQAGELVMDGVTATSASLLLPVLGGDKNFNATASLWLKQADADQWQRSIDLFRIRPELARNTKNSTGLSPSSFAGIVTGLQPSTEYDFKVILHDPDGLQAEQSISASTALSADIDLPPTGRVITVSNTATLLQAIRNVQPGDTIELTPGTYSTTLTISASGTASKPITLKGSVAQLATVMSNGSGPLLTITGNHIRVRDLSLTHGGTGVVISGNTDDVQIKGLHISAVYSGISAKGGHTNLVIHNNLLEGQAEPGDTSSDTWNYEGIVVTGQNIEVSNNTLSGFGDALGMSWQTSIANKSINIHHNQVLWTGDDGVEFDFSLRNVSAHHNLLANLANGLSFQPVWGGPVYAHHNMVVNAGRGPLKIKPEQDSPNGMLIYHNTFIRSDSDITYGGDYAWVNDSGYIRQLDIRNNLFVNSGNGATVLRNSSRHSLTQMDYNGWTTDGKFEFNLAAYAWGVNAASFNEWKSSPLGNHDVLIDNDTLFANYDAQLDELRFSDIRSLEGISLTLHGDSAASGAGVIIPGISAGTTTTNIGALEPGQTMPLTGSNLAQTTFSGLYAAPDYVQMEINTSRIFFPLGNDVTPEDQDIQTRIVGTASSALGSLQLLSDNSMRFTPVTDAMGSAEFKYELRSGDDISAASIYVQVVPSNNPPKANSDQVEAQEGETTVISVYELLVNDTDPDNDDLTVVSISSATAGNALLADNAIQYTPQDSSALRDSFTYMIEDSKGATSSATVTVNIISGGTLVGTSQRDYFDLAGRDESYVILGKGGPDVIIGSSGNDIIEGGDHEDHMWGGPGDDTFIYHGQDSRNDWIHGDDGFDVVLGDEEDNLIPIYEITGIEKIDGGDGFDEIRGTNYRQIWDFSNVELVSIELINGDRHGDVIIGSRGNDTLKGGHGDDNLNGGPGTDTAVYDGKAQDYSIETYGDTVYVTALQSDEGKDTLLHIEKLKFADVTISL